MKGFLLMWAFSPTDFHVGDAMAYDAFETIEQCEFVASEIQYEYPDTYTFCISLEELKPLRDASL